ncbi:siderophore-interacting protein [Microbacterium paulum]|uniref:siderophore-interacting protein n=1 Tax=Microbacterium paulum TaxID=2707006 RepID=UPI0030845D0B
MALSSRTAARPPRPTVEFEVVAVAHVSPQLVRVTLGGEGFAQFEDRPETDKYVKLKFTTPAPESLPVTRTYTVRRVDHDARTLDIDFVVHGDEGLAGPWAARARVGDRLSLMGPGGGYSPDPSADAHVFAGDLSALPAIAAALEALESAKPDARGHVVIEVDAETAIVPLPAPNAVQVEWIVDPAHDVEALAAVLGQLDWPEGTVQVFAHGERESMKTVRRVLFDERGLDRAHVSLSGYWARGRTEDRFQAEKREPIGKIL